MDILYVTSEAAPFCKTGGLADVLGSLPPAVAAGGDRAAVILPLYGQVSDAWREKMRWHGYTYVDLAWRHEYCGLFSLEYRGVVWYFLDNERYFRRGALYGQMDDGERFAFFSKAVVSVLPMLEWRPEVIHCNDWQTALVPIYLKTVAENVSTVFTIHNIEYQGKYGADTVEDLFGLNRGDWYESGVLQMDGCVNLMKGAMVTADAVTTVSPTYAAQLRESAYAAGLDSVVRSIQWKFSGVLNGIDMVSYDPECDPNLPARYTAAESEGKTICKAALQQELGLAQEEGTPVLSMVTRLVGHKGVDLVCQALDGIMATGCQLVVLGSGDGGYENFFRHAQNRYPGRLCAWIGYNEGLSRRIYAGSDLFLMPSKSEPCGLSQMIAMRYGTLPIVRETGGLRDSVQPYNRFTGEGTGFSFANFNAYELADTIRRALALYHDDHDAYCRVQRQAMSQDFSFTRSAEDYAHLYLLLLPEDTTPKHDAADEAFRSPIGALETGAAVRLAFADTEALVFDAAVELYGDAYSDTVAMTQTAAGFEAAVTMPAAPQALRYRFRLACNDGGIRWLCAAPDGRHARLCDAPGDGWRLTVYRAGFTTPAWFRTGVMYQIFPDRFARDSSATAQRGMEHHRRMGQTVHCHAGWDEPVEWQANTPEGAYAPVDFYGGTLRGIADRLHYLQKLGVTVLYLNPIFESASNHRYDTGDYRKVDPILGTNTDFKKLCAAAADCGIRIVLDGVFAHTGADSRYFNRFRHYPGCGAYNSRSSVYARWYSFAHYPDDYKCWWDFKDLPAVNAANPDWRKYMITGERSIVKTWLRDGASGWRLDVADELPDDVLRGMRSAAKETDPDSVLLGEVWEDAVTKVSYGERRQYALGDALDSVMNYPLRDGLVTFLTGRSTARALADLLLSQRLNYPRPLYYALMNLTASHDVARTRSALALDFDPRSRTRAELAALEITDAMAARGAQLQVLAAAVQFWLPGIPSIYYGDEAGMQGLCDPFNRAPLQMCDTQMLQWYAQLTALRHAHPALTRGEVAVFAPAGDVLCVLRVIAGTRDAFGEEAEDEALLLIVNRAAHPVRCHVELTCPGAGLCEETRLAFVRSEYDCAADCTDDTHIAIHDGVGAFDLPPYAAKIYRLENRHGTETGS